MARPKGIPLPVGTHVRIKNGRTATITKYLGRRKGYEVRWDEPRIVLGEERPVARSVYAIDLTPTEAKLHAKWEKMWHDLVPFVDRRWANGIT